MPLMNTHQVLHGARRPGLLDTYVVGLVATKPTVTVSGSTVTFAAGKMEFDGKQYPLEGVIDFSQFSTLLPAGPQPTTSCYRLFAVPKYHEPRSRVEAEDPEMPYQAAGVNYFVTHDSANGESYLHYFTPSYIEQMLNEAGGIEYLEYQYLKGSATGKEQRVYQQYYEEYYKSLDPAYYGKDLMPVGTEFVLAHISPSPTVPDPDATDQMNQGELTNYLATQSNVPTKMHNQVYTLTSPTAGTFFTGPADPGYAIPGQKIYKFRSIVLYPSEADADANTNAFPVSFPESLQDITDAYNYVTAPAPDGLGWPATVYAMAWEYYVPAYMPPGQIGWKPQIHRFFTKRNHPDLGRVNPIYMADNFNIPRICSGLSRRPAMMDYACPSSLIDVCLTVTAGDPPTVALNSTYKEVYDTPMGI